MTVFPAASLETFRDPAGSLRIEGDRVLRYVRPEFAAETLRFLGSDLAKGWVASGRMVPTTLNPESETQPGEGLCLEHEKIFFPSYPWEWVPGQWIAAASLTLDLCEESLADGLILKDATPLNVLFSGPRPVFVDVLSFEPRDPRSPIWLAYGQFVRTFLLPLAAHKYLGWPLAASLIRRDGYEPGDLYPYLSAAQRWRAPLRMLVTLPHLMERKKKPTSKFRPPAEVALSVLRRTIKSLRRTLRQLAPEERESRWSGYPENASHYSQDDHAKKQAFVRRALAVAGPRRVLDLGANTGVYSRIAAENGATVVSWDMDMPAAERSWRQALDQKLPILPLIANVARPTPATGWRNGENRSLLERATGSFECVLALGLLHHLLVMDQIPQAAIAGLLYELGGKWAIVEWVPTTDSQFVELCRGRENIYGSLSEESFLAAAEPYFSCSLREQLPNGRTLLLLQAKR